MIKNRKEMQTHINSLHLGKPWMKEENDEKVVHVYAPRNVPESGATFHRITYYRKSGLLASYTTQLFRPVRVPCSRFLSCQPNPSGTKLVFMLLFPEVMPRETHMTFAIVNLAEMVVSRNRIIVDLSSEEHARCKEGVFCSFCIAKALDATGSEYIISNIHGMLGAFSMATGNTVMAESQEQWVGCSVNLEKSGLVAASQVEVASTPKGLIVISYTAKTNTATLLHLVDKNSSRQRRITWRAFRAWQQRDQHSCTPSEQMLRQFQWTFSGHTNAHPECAIEALILDLADIAIQLVDGSFGEEDRDLFAAENRQLPFRRRDEKASGDG